MIHAKTAKEQTQETISEDMLKLDEYLDAAVRIFERKVIANISIGSFDAYVNYENINCLVKALPVRNLLIKELKKYLSKTLKYSVNDNGSTIIISWK